MFSSGISPAYHKLTDIEMLDTPSALRLLDRMSPNKQGLTLASWRLLAAAPLDRLR